MPGRDPTDAKGKGKSTDDDGRTSPLRQDTPTTATTATPAADGSSVFSRIAQSAAGLGRDLANTRLGGGELSALSSVAAGSKGASSSSAAPARESTSSHQGNFGNARPSAAGGFRSHAQQHAAAQEAAFSEFLDGTSVDLSMPEPPIIGGLSPAEDAWARAQWKTPPSQPVQSAQMPTESRPPALSDVAAQESRDGRDVVDLLSGNGPPEEEPDYDDIELAEDEATALKRALFGDSSGQSLTSAHDWDNVLNFIPDFVRPHPTGGYDHDNGYEGAASAKSHETQAAMGLPHSPETTRVWLDQWHGVLTRYDDEVWGGLSPLVAQARDEVDQLKETETEEPARLGSTKALDRLRQILGHLRVDG